MNNNHLYRSQVPSLLENASRPLWSVMIPTYNCADYLRETLSSVLAQDPGSDTMQIEVVDDHSTKDDPAAIVDELGGGRVSFYRQPQNVGHVKNFQTCLERSRGKIIHLLHGDDCVRAGFYQKLQQAFVTHPEIGAAFCRHIHMDEQGHWQHISWLEQSESGILNNWLTRIAVEQRIQTPSIVVQRKVYETLGAFDHRIRYWGEDWEMWVRIAAQYPVWYEIEPLALYRTRSVSLSGRSIHTGENIQDLRKAVEIIKDYLPPDISESSTQTALRNYAFYALNTARKLVHHGDYKGAMNQTREALRCYLSFKIVSSVIKLSVRVMYNQLKASVWPNKLTVDS